MKFKNKELLLGVLLGAGLNLLNSLRERLPDNLDDIKTKVRDTYGTASSRVSRASDALRGQENSHILGKVGALLIGVGVGVGVGLLIAPASGEETRTGISDKVSDFGEKVREQLQKGRRVQPGLTANRKKPNPRRVRLEVCAQRGRVESDLNAVVRVKRPIFRH